MMIPSSITHLNRSKMSKENEPLGKQQNSNDFIANVSHCAFSVYVDGCGRLIVIAKDEKEVAEKMKAEGFTKPFKILEALSFIA